MNKPRVTGVTEKGFQVMVEESDYESGKHLEETIAYIACVEGTFTFAGRTFEFGRVKMKNEDWSVVQLSEPVPEPLLFGQVMTYKGNSGVNLRYDYKEDGEFKMKMHEDSCGKADGKHHTEVIGWLVVGSLDKRTEIKQTSGGDEAEQNGCPEGYSASTTHTIDTVTTCSNDNRIDHVCHASAGTPCTFDECTALCNEDETCKFFFSHGAGHCSLYTNCDESRVPNQAGTTCAKVAGEAGGLSTNTETSSYSIATTFIKPAQDTILLLLAIFGVISTTHMIMNQLCRSKASYTTINLEV